MFFFLGNCNYYFHILAHCAKLFNEALENLKKKWKSLKSKNKTFHLTTKCTNKNNMNQYKRNLFEQKIQELVYKGNNSVKDILILGMTYKHMKNIIEKGNKSNFHSL